MTEQIPFLVYNDPDRGYDVEFVLYNTTPDYTDLAPPGEDEEEPPSETFVTSSMPSMDEEGWAVDSLGLTLDFSGPLNSTDAENVTFYSLEEISSGDPVAIDAVVYQENERRVVVFVESNFEPGTWYRLTVSSDIMDGGGQPIAGYTLEFKTQAQP